MAECSAALEGGTCRAQAQYCSLYYPDAMCNLNPLLAEPLAPTHGKFALLAPHPPGAAQAPAGDHALGKYFPQQRFMECPSPPRGE